MPERHPGTFVPNMAKKALFMAATVICAGFAFAQNKTDDPSSIAIIGGADGPTAVFLGSALARPVAPPDETRQPAPSNQSGALGRGRGAVAAERIRAAQVESEAQKYLKEHPGEFKPGETLPGWHEKFADAVGKAGAEKKPILALFTGSDWCAPCQNLEKNVLVQPAFKAFADKHLVTVFLDYPRNTKLADDVKKQNDDLAKKFSIEAYPTILLLSSDGEKAFWTHVGYNALFFDLLRDAVTKLDKEFPGTAKDVKEEMESEAKAKAEARAAKEKAEQERIEKERREREEVIRRRRIGTPIDLRGVSRPQPAEPSSDVVRPNPNPPSAADDQVYHIMPIGF